MTSCKLSQIVFRAVIKAVMDVGWMYHLERVQKLLGPPGTARLLVFFVEEKYQPTITKLQRATLLVKYEIFRLISGMNPLNITLSVVHRLDSLRAIM